MAPRPGMPPMRPMMGMPPMGMGNMQRPGGQPGMRGESLVIKTI